MINDATIYSIKVLIIAFILSFAALPATASEWTPIAHGNGVTLLINKKTIVRAGGITKAWFLYNYIYPYQGHFFEPVHLSKIETIRFRCSERTLLTPQIHYFSQRDGMGEQVYPPGVPVGPPSTVFNDIVPGSLGEIAFEYLCGGSKR